MDDETISLLATAPVGSMQLEIGLQSFNEKTLKAVNRVTNVEKLISNIQQLVANNNMHIHIDLIAGLPYEGVKSFEESFNTAYRLKPNMLQMGFLKLLYGSDMRVQVEKFPCEFKETPPYEVVKTPWIDCGEFAILHNIEDALDRIYNSGRFVRTLEYLLKQNLEPFELFRKLGEFLGDIELHKMPLNNYAELIFNFAITLEGVEKSALRDAMVCDRLTTDSSGVLPSFLRVLDPQLKSAKMALNSHKTSESKAGVKRAIALLYSEGCGVYVDYDNRNPMTGEYTINKFWFK